MRQLSDGHRLDYRSGDNRMNARGMYAFSLMSGMTGKRADAALCKQCKKCVEACPQSIDIPTELGNVHRTLGGLRTKMLMPLVRMMFSTEVKE